MSKVDCAGTAASCNRSILSIIFIFLLPPISSHSIPKPQKSHQTETFSLLKSDFYLDVYAWQHVEPDAVENCESFNCNML